VNTVEGILHPATPSRSLHTIKIVGRGYINPQSQILVRLLTREKSEVIDESFLYGHLKEAWEYRQRLGYTENCRLVFGKPDYLPALIIDKFNDYFVIQTWPWAWTGWKPAIVNALEQLFQPKGIYEPMMFRYGNWKDFRSRRASCPRLSIRRSLSGKWYPDACRPGERPEDGLLFGPA